VARRSRSSRSSRWLSKRKIAYALAGSAVAGAIAGKFTHEREHAQRAKPTATTPASSASSGASHRPKLLEVTESIYDGRLGPKWQDWGWGRHDLSAGTARVVFEGYAGIVFHHQELSARFGGLSFRFKANPTWAPFLAVSLRHAGQSTTDFPHLEVKAEDIADVGNGWQEVWIAWSRLNPHALPIDAIVISASRQVGPEWVELDKVALTKPAPGSAEVPLTDAALTIRCDEAAVPISPFIYGVSMGVWETGTTANRIGGNPMSRLNWDLGATWNAGRDWFFENTKGTGSIWEWIDDAAAHRASTAVVVPMLGWVAKDTTSFGFPVSKFGKQRATDPYRPDAGSGFAPDGSKLTPGPPTQTSVSAPPNKIGHWVSTLRDKDRARSTRSVYMYVLDNEPSLWNETHRDVHPDAVGYDELLDRTLRYASAIRQADPDTLIAGPAEWGWTAYFFSAKDREAGVELRPDRRTHGDVPLIPWYLTQLAEREKKTGIRLLDVLDLHFYPQPDGIFGPNARVDPEAAALRLRSTRALWDPSYVDESWIKEPVRLIPRMHDWVADNYPGLKTSIGEWNFGGDDHISGALAAAEALGRFGQQGLDFAFYWAGPAPTTRTYWAFRAYRNFDGRGGRFLDWSVPTQEAEHVSFFASRDDQKTHLVALILNLNPGTAVETHVDTTSCGKLKSARAFSYGDSSSALAEHVTTPTATGLITRLEPYSIEVLDLTVDAPPH
jgi:hypothetical protein